MRIIDDTLGGGMDSVTAEMLVKMWFDDALQNTIRDAKRKFVENEDERH